jgi:uncharacterized protein (DUF1501 family)
MAMKRPGVFSRRDVLRLGGLGAAGSLLWGRTSRAAPASVPRRFVQINLEGGWDSALATDPVIGSKQTSNGYEGLYTSMSELTPKAVPGKPGLVLGPGLIPGENAFARMPTAFVNGMYMEVSSHDFAAQYMSSGLLSLSNSRDYPCIPAVLGASSTVFPAHVVVGYPAPLGDTRFTTPPLYSPTIDALDTIVGEPSEAIIGAGVLRDHFSQQQVADAHRLIEALDAQTYGTLRPSYQADLAIWRESSVKLEEIYALGLGGTLAPTLDDEIRYGEPAPGTLSQSPERVLASLYLLMKSNLCPYVTVSFASFDTHSDHLATHLPLMQRFASALDVFVTDLLATPDPAAPGYTLAETTTILITSEFVRTPLFSSVGGTEHWQSASAILMGRGVVDGAVIGATDDQAAAVGWSLAEGVPSAEALLPDHLIATILANVGTDEQADTVSTERITGLFVA